MLQHTREIINKVRPFYPLDLDDYLSSSITVKEAAEAIYPYVAFDTALPQDWVDHWREDHHREVRGAFVWGYPRTDQWADRPISGLPLPLVRETFEDLLRIEPVGFVATQQYLIHARRLVREG